MIEIDRIYNEDCLEGMKRIADGAVDCIITDLPYGVLNEQSEGGSWDSIIPLEPMWEQFKRVTKPNAAIVLFCQGMFTAKLMMSQPKMWRYNLVWDKGRVNGFLNAKRMPMRQHEDIAVFYQSLPTYNPQMLKCAPHQRNHGQGSLGKVTNRCYGNFTPTPQEISDEKYPASIIYFAKGHDTQSWLHPTQKPIDLIRYLILTYTNVGGGSSRCNDWQRHNGCGGSDGETALYRLRDQQGVFRHRAGSYRRSAAKPHVILNPCHPLRSALPLATIGTQESVVEKNN